MYRWSISCLSMVFLFLSGTVFAEPELVGDLGDPDRIVLVGNRTFDVRLIRAALGRDVDFLVAGHPTESLKGLLDVVQGRIRDGYLNVGFVDAAVTVAYDATRSAIVATIEEGPRRVCGKIEITGASTIPVDRFSANLKTARVEYVEMKPPTANPALWQVGRPASFSPDYWNSREEAFRDELKSIGYFDVSFSTSVRPESDGTATLIVAIHDEGPRAILGDIEVVGATRNSVDAVIQYLDLPKGLLLDADAKSKIEEKLRDSGRFIKQEIEVISPPFGNAPSLLRLKLVEFPDMPLLTEKLPAEADVMIRLTQWLNRMESTDDDLDLHVIRPHSVIEGRTIPAGTWISEVRLVISHRDEGGLIRVRTAEHPDQTRFDCWVHLTPKRMRLFCPRRNLACEFNLLVDYTTFHLSWSAILPDAQGRANHMNFGVLTGKSDIAKSAPGAKTRGRLPLDLLIKVAPAAALGSFYKSRDKARLANGVLTLDMPEGELRVDAATGRMIGLKSLKSPQELLMIRYEPGRYKHLLAEYERISSKAKTMPATGLPVSDMLYFLATCARESPSGNRRSMDLTSLVHALLKREAFSAFDALFLDYLDRPDDHFSIPMSKATSRKGSVMPQVAFYVAVVRQIIPKTGWPIRLCRGFVGAVSTNSMMPAKTLLEDTSSGPLAKLGAACVFGLASPQLKSGFARVAQGYLQREAFLRDCEPFLSDESPIGRVLLAMAQTLQQMDEPEIESLVHQFQLDGVDRQALLQVLLVFPSRPADPPARVLRSAIDEAWTPFIEPGLRALLKSME